MPKGDVLQRALRAVLGGELEQVCEEGEVGRRGIIGARRLDVQASPGYGASTARPDGVGETGRGFREPQGSTQLQRVATKCRRNSSPNFRSRIARRSSRSCAVISESV